MGRYVVGRILKSFGIKGFVKIEPFTHSPQRYESHLAGRVAYVGEDEQSAKRMVVDHVNVTQNGILVKFHSVDDKTSSDALMNQFLFVDEGDLIPPPKGSYFIHDIIGCSVWVDNKPIGNVVEVYLRPQGFAQDVWIIERQGQADEPDGRTRKRYWLPAVPEVIQSVDVVRRKIILNGMNSLVEE